jgi:hypothetical protein
MLTADALRRYAHPDVPDAILDQIAAHLQGVQLGSAYVLTGFNAIPGTSSVYRHYWDIDLTFEVPNVLNDQPIFDAVVRMSFKVYREHR